MADSIVETFSGGRYSVVTLEKDTVLNRAGTVDKPIGQFFSAGSSSGILPSRIDKAVLPEWSGDAKSPLDATFEIKIPAGTKEYVGEVGSQSGLYVGLHAIGVDESSYSLGTIRHGECVCVVLEGGKWKVYYFERDLPAELAVVDSEEQAYEVVFELFCK